MNTTNRQNFKIQKWVAGISLLLLAVKLIAYYSTHSVAILTDALESIVNVAAGFIGLFSLYVAAKPKDKDHPYGHGKAEFLSAAIEGTMIVTAGLIILYKAVQNLFFPVALHKIDFGIILIAIAGLINFVTGTICLRTGKKNNSPALMASGRHLQTDTYSTMGILVGLVLLYVSDFYWIDSTVAILFGLIIVITGYKIIRRSVAGIMDEADTALLKQFAGVLESNRLEGWVDLHNLRVIKYGNVLHVDAHLTVPWYLNVNEAHQEIDELASQIRRDFGQSLELFVHTDGCLFSQCPICTKKECPVRKQEFVKRVEWTLETISQNKKHEFI